MNESLKEELDNAIRDVDPYLLVHQNAEELLERRYSSMLCEIQGRTMPARAFKRNKLVRKVWCLFQERLLARQETINETMLFLARDIHHTEQSISRDHASRRLLMVIPYDITRMNSGGAKRMVHLACALQDYCRVEILNIVSELKMPSIDYIMPGLKVCSVPRTASFMQRVDELRGLYKDAAPLVALAKHWQEMPMLQHWLKCMASASDWVLFDGPCWFPLLDDLKIDSKALYESHDFHPAYFEMLSGLSRDSKELAELEDIERRMCSVANAVFVVTRRDGERMISKYPEVRGKIALVENGVAIDRVIHLSPAQRQSLKDAVGFKPPTVLFVGSAGHPPNTDAVSTIINEIAPRCLEQLFVVIGFSESDYYVSARADDVRNQNVVFAGRVSEKEKDAIFALADVAICPMQVGCGSSLKIAEYVASGLPVVTTRYGMRGFEVVEEYLCIVDSNEMPAAIKTTLSRIRDDDMSSSLTTAYRSVKEELDWGVISRALVRVLKGLVGDASS